MEQAWCQLEQRMEANTTLVYVSQQVSQSLFQCLLCCRRGVALLSILVFVGYRAGQDMLAQPRTRTQQWQGHSASVCPLHHET